MSSDEPVVSVVIPAYNVGPFIAEAVRSVLAQTYTCLEVVVVNDGSTDDTRERLCALHDPRLRIIEQPNSGFCAARNVGVRAARGRYIAFVDGDDYSERCALDVLVRYLDDHPEADVAHGRVRIVTEAGEHTGRVVGRDTPGPARLQDLIVRNLVIMSGVVVRRSAFERAGGFDPAFPGSEDHDLWIRVAMLRPNNVHSVPVIVGNYRQRRGQVTRDWRAMHKGGLLLLEKIATLAPEVMSEVRRDAEAHLNRYVGFIAFEAGDLAQARRFLGAALRNLGRSILADRRFWLLAILVISGTVMPAPLHRFAYRACRRAQARIAGRHHVVGAAPAGAPGEP